MRKIYYLPLALAALAMGSCSSEDTAAESGKPTNFADGGYMKMSINMPTRSANGGFKAANDNFEDGLASEYAVNNATLILFQGSDEASAKFHSAYALPTNTTGENDNPNQITVTMRIVKRVADDITGNEGDKLYALVVVNNNGLVAVDAENKATINGKAFEGTIQDLQKMIVSGGVSKFSTTGLLMTNAPLSTVAGGENKPDGATVQTLTDVTNDVYSSEAAASAQPAAEIYVERAVAKVTLTSSVAKLSSTDEGIRNVAATVTGWTLTNTNTESYLVRNTIESRPYLTLMSAYTTEANKYRFVGHTAVKPDESLYRTYWAQDPNYDAFTEGKLFYSSNPADYTFSTNLDEVHPLYCMENTFNVANQEKRSTTQAVVRATLGTPDENTGVAPTFYTINNDRTQMYTADGRDAAVKSSILGNSDVIAWVKANGDGTTAEASSVSINFADSKDAATGVLPLTSFTITLNNKTFTADATTNTEALNAVNKDAVVYEYTNGVSYYPALIKHFGDDLTPWNTNEHPATVADVYENNNEGKFLGRYGVLRNNWYTLNVNSIRAIGSPVVPPVPTEPDDDLYNYISVSVNILSWAKRSQNVDL